MFQSSKLCILYPDTSELTSSQLVFASQCYHWPRLIAPSAENAQADQSTLKRSPSPELRSIEEEETEEGPSQGMTEKDNDGDSDGDSYSGSDSVGSSSTIVPTPPTSSRQHEEQVTPPPPVLQLPIQALPLPSPETYSYIHNLLHFTHSPAPSTFSPLQNILGMEVGQLHKLDTKDLMKKLAIIQGIWKNCVYLGVGDAKIWIGMRDAWGSVVGIVAERHRNAAGSTAGGDINMSI